MPNNSTNASATSRKIIVMGHSTGCQVSMEYLVGDGAETRAPVEGVILQASISDREAMGFLLSKSLYEESVKIAQAWVEDGRGEDVLPESATQGFFGSPCCARRWLSLTSPGHDGDDDYFSSDLSDEQFQKTFGGLPKTTPLLLCYSGKDQFVPSFVDKKALIEKWRGFVERGEGVIDQKSGLIEGASHNLIGDPDEVVQSLVEMVVAFVGKFSDQGMTSNKAQSRVSLSF
jgi:alpha-beta hydrolase superfamily lysophospholipase